ncbi:hypothetical protein RFI_21985 [Reticulomyxa filosa]|uniref:Uncharacterized protein n=1 Tax=Reticulomyxa filosa TaxID=46433 RepID=X6MNI0_RETFI|nr:hypothetical protein RFI_21985 [Reticulomyxa filosa]|eukprot:ETO15379.1 hypothetical protein RFI_21985 [Reticulomyxa filosa]
MFFDDRPLCKNILERDEVTLAIERAEIEEYFTGQHLCFWLHRYRMDEGGVYGKIYPRKEIVIGKKEKVIDLKKKIVELYKNEQMSVENIVIMKGWSTVTMTPQSCSRLEWYHNTVLKTLPQDHGKSEEELFAMQRDAIAVQNEEIIGTPSGFHLRSGDVLVWQDMLCAHFFFFFFVKIKPNKNFFHFCYKHVFLLLIDVVVVVVVVLPYTKRLQKNPNFKPGTNFRTTTGPFETSLTILTHEEWQQREQQKKLDEEKRAKEKALVQEQAQTNPSTAVENSTDEEFNKKDKPIIMSNDEVDLQKKIQEENKSLQRKKSF